MRRRRNREEWLGQLGDEEEAAAYRPEDSAGCLEFLMGWREQGGGRRQCRFPGYGMFKDPPVLSLMQPLLSY